MITGDKIDKLYQDILKNNAGLVESERDTITSLVNPFIDLLGYNRLSLIEYKQEYSAGYLGRREAVDIALLNGENNPIIFIECKKLGHTFRKNNIGQVQQYYNAAKRYSNNDLILSILTDGDHYRLFTETQNEFHLDDEHFIDFKLSSILDSSDFVIEIIQLISKEHFDKKRILDFAAQQRYYSGVYNTLVSEFKAPSEDFIRFLIRPFFPEKKRLTTGMIEETFKSVVWQATQQFKSDLGGNDDIIPINPPVETTDSEVNGYRVLLSTLKDSIDINRLTHRDTPECFFIYLDNDTSKTVCSFWFNNESNKKICLYDNHPKGDKVSIQNVIEIESYKNRLVARLNQVEPRILSPDTKPKKRKLRFKDGIYEGFSIEEINNNKIQSVPFGEGVARFKDGKVMEGKWQKWKLIKGKIVKHGKLIGMRGD